MTMVIGVAVKPKGSRKPFFLMGADSKKVDVIDIIDGEYILDINENFDKIYEVGDKLISLAGRIPPDIFKDLLEFMNQNLSDMERTCEVTFNFIKNYLSQTKLPEGLNYWRLRAIIGCTEKGYPQIAIISIDTRDLLNSGYQIINQKSYGFHVEFIGNTRKTEDLQLKFINDNRTKNTNLTLLEVEKSARQYLTESVKRYPDKCNNNFKLKKLIITS